MTAKQQEICDIIETLPEELSEKVIEYIEYLKFTTVINKTPEKVTIRDEEDLRKKLKKGIEASESGKCCSVEEAFDKIEKILTD